MRNGGQELSHRSQCCSPGLLDTPCPKLLCSLLSTVSSGTAKGQAAPRKTTGQEGDEGLGMVAHGLLWRG